MSTNIALGGNRLSRPRILRTGHPLTDSQIASVAPAVFSPGPHSSRAESYAYVPTNRVLESLRERGWGVYEVSQQRSRREDRDPYTKHMLRMRPLAQWDNEADTAREGATEVCVINAHDGTAAYHLYAGFLRFVCSNGMIVGDAFSAFKVRHTTFDVTRKLVVENAEEIVTNDFPKVAERMDLMRQRTLAAEEQYELARTALKLRYGDMLPPFNADLLLMERRQDDRGDSLWHVFNRIQENLLYGGFETRSLMFNRRSMVRPVERVTAVVNMNRGLWNAAERLLPAPV